MTLDPTRLRGDILTPAGFVRGTLHIQDGHITRIDGDPLPTAQAGHGGQPLLLPGFIDLHVHGGGGSDLMDTGEAVATIARTHARHGTTALLATTMTAPLDEIRAALHAIAPAIAQRPAGGARVLGVHLEGPYLAPGRLGAQPGYTRALTLAEVSALHAIAPLTVITLAPEVDGHLDLITALTAAGHRVQLGHSNARYEDGVAALRCGAVSFTHLFNAMSALHHREPGLVGAALAHAQHAEVIPDLLHVHPGAIHAALRAIPGLYCVSDATAATGMPDGDYRLGRHTVRKCGNGVRLADGTLAGSALTLDQALRNLVQIGLPLDEAARRVSTHAADYLGRHDLGRIAPGAHADVVVLDRALQVQQVIVAGEAL
jgi:N-acetylglucosamine-6-phosphate deacetylase